ncbi:hypothetical protein MP638_007340 [Amoeboaphelidium occidentale]|nr:hypothetical protein MP638_007340 [Amoeboaphelidium occidentale]
MMNGTAEQQQQQQQQQQQINELNLKLERILLHLESLQKQQQIRYNLPPPEIKRDVSIQCDLESQHQSILTPPSFTQSSSSNVLNRKRRLFMTENEQNAFIRELEVIHSKEEVVMMESDDGEFDNLRVLQQFYLNK